jgi:hypothetical protein
MIISRRCRGVFAALVFTMYSSHLQSSMTRTGGSEGAVAGATSAITAPEAAWDVQASADVTDDGRIGQLVVYKDCGTQGCMFEVRLGSPPHQTTLFQTTAKSCSILNTRTAGHADIECVQLHWVEAPRVSWIRVTNLYRWTGTAYASPLDYFDDGVKPIKLAPCNTVRITEPANVLILPAQGVRVSELRSGGVPGWKTGPARTPTIGHLTRGARVPALEQVTSAKAGVWLLVRLGEHSAGWVESRQTLCATSTAE